MHRREWLPLTGNFWMEFCYVDKSWVLEPL